MRLQLVATIAAAVGFLAIGCGPNPSTGGGTGKAGDSSKTTPTNQPAGGDKAKELTSKAKAAYDENNKEYEALQKALGTLKEKVTTDKKEAKDDANKLEVAGKLAEKKDAAEKLVKDIGDKLTAIKDLKDIKDTAALDAAVKAVKEWIEKVKPTLKDYMPK